MRKRIFKVLNELGVSCDIKGRQYLEYAIGHAMANGHMSLTKELYPNIALAFETTKSKAERAIRFAVERTFLNCPQDTLVKYFGNTIDYYSGKLTNGQFIFGVAEYLTVFKEEGETQDGED